MSVIIAAHDISGVGRCSLVTALAVLPVMGHTCYPMPTAVLSQQTGLKGYSYIDLTDEMPRYINGWKSLNIKPDMIYTGFLGSPRQPGILAGYIRGHQGAVVVVDPVMGDNGSLYGCFDAEYTKEMSALAKTANILTPNLTEFNLLCGRNAGEPLPSDDGEILHLAGSIGAQALTHIIITSAKAGDGARNLLIDMGGHCVKRLPCRNSGVSYSGTGDLFASVLCGRIASGADIEDAVILAADFVSDCVEAMPETADLRFGINYEQKLCRLMNLSEVHG